MTDGDASAFNRDIRALARDLGFDAVGVTRPDAIADAAPRLAAYLADGRHGDMHWMAETSERRANPMVLWPNVRSIVMVGLSYAPASDPMALLDARERAVISVYAQGRDYHDVLKKKLKTLAGHIAERTGGDVKVFVDTAPLLEKPLAAAAGIGWQGKHTNLVSRTHGSWLFLGAVLTTADIAPDAREENHCGSCRRCLDVCPTQAFPAPYQLDARRCLAYLSIEHKGHIPDEFRKPMGNRVFGCDDCLAVCPWNKFAETAREAEFKARLDSANPPIAEILALDDAHFRRRFAGTPVKRTGRDRVVRNALIAAGNALDPQFDEQIEGHLSDASPLVRAMAVWALARQFERPGADRDHLARLRAAHMPREHDDAVKHEWLASETATRA